MLSRRHTLQQLLPLCLLAAFMLSAVLAVLFSASLYRDVQDRSARLTEATALTYIAEKVHQSDQAGAIRVGTIGECPALIIRQDAGSLYDTYIYVYDGSLRELMIKCELDPAPKMGRPLLELEALDLSLEEGLLSLRLRCTSGEIREGLVCLRSREVG